MKITLTGGNSGPLWR